VPMSKFPPAKLQRPGPTSRSSTTVCRSRSISSSTIRTVLNRASIDNKPVEPEIVTHLMEGIGIALDIPSDRMFVTDLAGSVYSADLDGKNERNFLYAQGNLTGIAYAEI
jgi:hypothetical protein